MAQQNRGPEGLYFKRNRLGLRLLFIFILALMMNIALSSSKPTQNVRFKRDDDEEIHSLENYTGDGGGPTIREKADTDKIRNDTKTNYVKKSSQALFDDDDAENPVDNEEFHWEKVPGEKSGLKIAASASTTEATISSSRAQQQPNNATKNDDEEVDEGEEGVDDDEEDTDTDTDYDTNSADKPVVAPESNPSPVNENKAAPVNTSKQQSPESQESQELQELQESSSATTNVEASPATESPQSPSRDDSISNDDYTRRLPNGKNLTSTEDVKSGVPVSASFRLSNVASLTVSILFLHFSRV